MNINKIVIVVGFISLITGAGLYFLLYKTSFSKSSENYQIYKNSQTGDIYQNVLANCSDKSLSCLEEQIKQVTKQYGPKTSLDVLRILQDNGLVEKTVDDHQIAHAVGKDTVDFFGINPEAFLSCPTSFNYGCQHGFFEAALVKEKPAKRAIDLICGALDPAKYSSKFIFYCYHGVGHGVMDAEAYDLKSSIAICDTLDTAPEQNGCWQGVFMENVNAGMRGEARKDAFSSTDPLVPCNRVDYKYRHECYINHAGWLMSFFKGNVERAVAACSGAENYTNICLQSLGLMATNPVWQPTLLGGGYSSNKDTIKTAKEICLKFPSTYREQCVVAGVDNILNFDEFNTLRAQRFCDIVEQRLQSPCYQHIGLSLKSQTTNPLVVKEKCSAFAENFKQECLKGAGLL